MEWLTNLIAAAGIASWLSPDLLQGIESVSHGAALLMPIFGVIWLGVQIWSKLVRGR